MNPFQRLKKDLVESTDPEFNAAAKYVNTEKLRAAQQQQNQMTAQGQQLSLAQVLLKMELITTDQFVEIRRQKETAMVSTQPHPSPAAEPRRRIGKYEIVRELGRGGMSVVLEAVDPDLGRRVALKVLKETDASPELIERLHREAAAAASLRHPNIVAVHEVGSLSQPEGMVHYIVMDLIEGRTLYDLEGQLTQDQQLRVLEILARAVGYAHEQRIIHRDLKPQNVLLESAPPHLGVPWRVFLADFGLAKVIEADHLTQTGTVMGTVHYMAPEQVRGDLREIGPWTDVWSLGVMLYQTLTGKLPFDGQSLIAVYEQVSKGEPAPPRTIQKSVSRELETICMRALEKNNRRRYPDGNALAEELRRHREGEPILAKPSTF
jgi:eukaryotic-like serine/threonine-protein kinase